MRHLRPAESSVGDGSSQAHRTAGVDEVELQNLALRSGAVELLVLFGSRARETAHQLSDWDLGYLAAQGAGFDPMGFAAQLRRVLRSDDVDLVDLRHASGLLRFRAARDGKALFERSGAFKRFQLQACRFWCDAEPVLRRAYAEQLRKLG